MHETDEFDPSFYAGFYTDLRDLSGPELAEHFAQSGVREGRHGTIASLFAAHGVDPNHLPKAFTPAGYADANPDVLAAYRTATACLGHYLISGRHEGRRFTSFDLDLVRRMASEDGHPASDTTALRWLWGRGIEAPLTPRLALSKHGLSPLLLELFDYGFYRCVAGVAFETVDDAVRHFAEEGVERCLPLGPDHVPDQAVITGIARAASETEAEAETSFASLRDAYRWWLHEGIETARFVSIAGMYQRYRIDADPDGLVRLARRLGRRARRQGVAARFRRAPTLGDAVEAFLRPERFAVERAGASDPVLRAFLSNSERLREEAASVPGHTASTARAGDGTRGTEADDDRPTMRRDDPPEDHFGLARRAMLDVLSDATNEEAERRWREHRVLFAEQAGKDVLDIALKGRVAEARAAATRACDAFGTLIRGEAYVPKPPSDRSGRVALIASTMLPQCTFYRVTQKVEQLSAAGVEVDLFEFGGPLDRFMARAHTYDAAVFYRVPAYLDVANAIDRARDAGVATFYEVDDLVFDPADYPEPYESFAGQIDETVYAGLVASAVQMQCAMRLCDFGIASTRALARSMRRYVRSGDCLVHPNGIGRSHERAMREPLRSEAEDRTATVRVFYGSGTLSHQAALGPVNAALDEIARRRDDVELILCGHVDDADLPETLRERTTTYPLVPNTDVYWSFLRQADVNLAALERSPFTDAKSEIKWLEAAMFGIPSVCTATETMAAAIEDGRTGVLVQEPGGWHDALDALIGDAERREEVGEKARRAVLDRYAGSVLGPDLLAAMEARAFGTAKPRVLVCNVYYPPETTGGATRVVMDNVAHLRREHGDAFEVEVVTTMPSAPDLPPYAYRTWIAGGVRVHGIARPPNRSDWNAYDPAMHAALLTLFRRLSPDLVHLHCVQQLTTAVADAASELGVPYIVTVHDGWWISDNQFLIDENGDRKVYETSLVQEARKRGGTAAARAALMRRVLSGAERVLSVSESFSELYEPHVGRPVDVTPNGLDPERWRRVEATSAGAGDDGPVRVAMMGGRFHHKGFAQVAAALVTNRFAGLEFVLVDFALEEGETYRQDLGGNVVHNVARTRGRATEALYSSTDVVLFPSLCYESFGLVPREAALSGCWVVCSDRGGAAENFVSWPGALIVEPSVEAITAALREVEREPERFKSPPPDWTDYLSTAAAADLVAGHYEEARKP